MHPSPASTARSSGQAAAPAHVSVDVALHHLQTAVGQAAVDRGLRAGPGTAGRTAHCEEPLNKQTSRQEEACQLLNLPALLLRPIGYAKSLHAPAACTTLQDNWLPDTRFPEAGPIAASAPRTRLLPTVATRSASSGDQWLKAPQYSGCLWPSTSLRPQSRWAHYGDSRRQAAAVAAAAAASRGGLQGQALNP